MTVLLHSLGGTLNASLDIGRFIGDKKWNTLTETVCWSGCAYIWLAGAQRFKTANAYMGFRGAQHSVAGYFRIRNFLLGLGYSGEMAEAILSLGPNEWITLNNESAKRLGITFGTTKRTLPANAFAGVYMGPPHRTSFEPALVTGLKELFEKLRQSNSR